MGPNDASPERKPQVIPALQNRGVISIVLGDYQFGALLESGKLLTWGMVGSTGLGDPYSIEPGQPGGFRTAQEKTRSLTAYQNIPDVHNPTEVRFDHELSQPRERFVFAAAAAGWHMGALVVDLEEVGNSGQYMIESNLVQGEPRAKKVVPDLADSDDDHEIPEVALPIAGPSSTGIFSPFLYRGAMLPRQSNPMQGIHPPPNLEE